MDKDRILENQKYDYKQESFFKRNEVKIEVFALIFVALGLFYLGSAILFRSTISAKINNNPSVATTKPADKTSDVKDKDITPDNKDNKQNSTTSPTGENQPNAPEQSNKVNRLTVKDVLGTTIYSKEHTVAEVVIIDNVQPGSYFLSGITDHALFTTTTANNKVKCTIADNVQETVCTVEEISTPTE